METWSKVWPSLSFSISVHGKCIMIKSTCKLECLNQHNFDRQMLAQCEIISPCQSHTFYTPNNAQRSSYWPLWFISYLEWWDVMLILPLLLSVNMITCMTTQCNFVNQIIHKSSCFFLRTVYKWLMAAVARYIMGVTWMLYSMSMETR